MSEVQIYNPFDPRGIATDTDAESAVVWLRERADERDRLITISDEMILKYQNAQAKARESYERDTEVTTNNLAAYALEHVTKETKTTRKTILPTASLVWKSKGDKVEKDDNVLKIWAKHYAPQYIEQTVIEKVLWAELKEKSTQVGNKYQFVTEDGEILPVDGVTLTPQPDTFTIE